MITRSGKRTCSLRALASTALVVATALLAAAAPAVAQSEYPDTYTGSDLWLHYAPVSDPALLQQYKDNVKAIVVENAPANPSYRHTPVLVQYPGSSQTLEDSTLDAAKDELVKGLGGLLSEQLPVTTSAGGAIPDGAVVVGTPTSSPAVKQSIQPAELVLVGEQGYVIRSVSNADAHFTLIAANTDIGALYGTYAFLRLLQTQKPITGLRIADWPRLKDRVIDNWETTRLYAGNNATGTGGLNGEDGSIFDFEATGQSAAMNLPVILDRYLVMARALASVGINGIEINCVNASDNYLRWDYMQQEAALADALRPYGIRVSLAVNYTAPTDPIFAPDVLTSSQMDPTSSAFQQWWYRKALEIQQFIPDFMGFTVKASSEGQPGPEMFGYDEGDGANGMAAAVAPLGMKIFWRTFVYDASIDHDRLKRAYLTFGPINDKRRFLSNVVLQTKNSPLDFQAREPFHPMFGRMGNTNQAMELEITQEYTGQNTMLDYLGPMWQEVLRSDTYATDGAGNLLSRRLVGNIIDGSAQGQVNTAMVGVGNLGNADDLTGHQFSQANLFAFGRLAWNWTEDSRDIAEDWVRMTWSNDQHVVDTIVQMMMGSREALVSYQTPLGIAHQMRSSDHYGPNPSEWFTEDDWSPVYYNQADSAGLGFDRSRTGSDFVDQYFPALAERFNNIATTPENLLMWFHHVPWDHRMNDGRTFWDELVYRYQMGVQYVTWMRETWDSLKPYIDGLRFSEVQAKLAQQEIDAASWRDTCVNYWKEFSGRTIPVDNGPLSVKIVVAGKEFGGFDLSAASYTIPVAAGGSPQITQVRAADPAARYQIVTQAPGVPGQAVVKVTKDDFFGPIVKNYVFKMVTDTTLASLTVNGQSLASFRPDVLAYNAVVPAGVTAAPSVQAVADDPAASVTVQQASSPTGQATITVTNQGSSSVYTVSFHTMLTGSDDFTETTLGPQWHWVREDPSNWSLTPGALVIRSQAGDLQGSTNTAKNLALQSVDGDWNEEAKLVFSRPLANNNEQGGIIAYGDDDNYVKLAWEMSDSTQAINKLHVVLLREQSAADTTTQVTGADAQHIVGPDGAIWLRLTKTGTTYRGYYSRDGSVWRFMGSATLTAPVTQAGLLAFNRAGTSTDLRVAFDYFHIKSLGDPLAAGAG